MIIITIIITIGDNNIHNIMTITIMKIIMIIVIMITITFQFNFIQFNQNSSEPARKDHPWQFS